MSVFKICPHNNQECIHEIYAGEPNYKYCKKCSVYKSMQNTSVKELRDMLDGLICQGKGDYTVDFIIFTGYERGHETSDSKIKLNGVDDDDKTILLQGDR